MRILNSRSLLGGVFLSFLVVGASCASEDAEDLDTDGTGGSTDPDPTDPDPDPTDPDPDPGTALPVCAGASDGYLQALHTEVVDYFGPNISVILPDDDVVVVYPTTDQYGTGSWNFPDTSEWTVELCVNWDENISDCESVLYPLEGSFQITNLEEDETLPTEVNGRFVAASFVDDLSNPTCQVRVNVSFNL